MYRRDPIISSSPPPGAEARSAHFSGSSDELSEPYVTQATLPWSPQRPSRTTSRAPDSSYAPYGPTQPTQILHSPHRPQQRAHIQVARSSPQATYQASASRVLNFMSSQPHVPVPVPMNLMQPQGTYRVFNPQPVARPPLIDITSDDPPVDIDSQDEDIRGSNIRPSNFELMRSTTSVVEETPQKPSFGSGLSGYAYDASRKRSADDDISSPPQMKRVQVGRQTGPSRAMPVQAGPSRAMPVRADLRLEDIQREDYRRKVQRLKALNPSWSIRMLYDTLVAYRGDYEAAKRVVDRDLDDELNSSPQRGVAVSRAPTAPTYQPKKTTQRGLAVPIQSIQDKFSKVRQSKPQPETITISDSPPKPKRRLIRGPRPGGSSAKSIHVSEDEDEGIRLQNSDDSDASAEEEVELDEEGLLEFFNTCSVEAMVDLSSQKEEDIRAILDKRPFESLADIEDTHVGGSEPKNGKKARKPKITFGKRLVESASNMWYGFNAVDQLVQQCQARGKPIAAGMATWGVDVFGASTDGELALTNLETLGDTRDSGLGTPSGAGTPRSSNGSERDLESSRKSRTGKATLLKKPSVMSPDIELKDYQVVGLNWLNLLWENGVSGILADDMGLGKTCQVISFLSHLYEQNVPGPHLIVVPGSTLENWLREFENFAPQLKEHVEPYYGLQAARMEQQQIILDNLDDIYVIVTTYDLACKPADNKFLRQCKPQACIFDEGHVLRNSVTQRYKSLMRIPAKFRLLLTGTPLQNSLRELASILAFIMPDIFNEVKDNLEVVFKHKAKVNEADSHELLLSTQRIQRARSMMTPFILRRKKAQVLKHLPKKTCRVEYCELTDLQRKLYSAEREKQKQVLIDRANGIQSKEQTNVMMKLRQAAIHPLLFRVHYTDKIIQEMAKACLKEERFANSVSDIIYEELQQYQDYQCHELCTKYPGALGRFALKNEEWMDSGKVKKLAELLKGYIENGDRTLIFSQFTSVMDILQWVLDTLDISYSRLDGQTPIVERQALLDQFYKDESISVFMLSTKSGGAGINLACANKVIIFDSSFNPQDDVQAENRAHRVGQTREVEVVRLVTRETVEEQIHALGVSKLELDKMVSGEGIKEEEVEGRGMEAVEKMMLEELKEENGDVREVFLNGLKSAGLDMSAA